VSTNKEKDKVSFNFYVTKLRRKRILEALQSSDVSVKKPSERIMKNFANQVENKFIRDKLEGGASE